MSDEDDLPFGLGGAREPHTVVHSYRPEKPQLPKRFYKVAQAGEGEAGYRVLLDGRPIRTPAKRVLEVPVPRLAEDIAAEWDAQSDEIDPAGMPLTRLANSALDRVAPAREAILAEIANYAESDLICYRADAPPLLVERQSLHWDPLVAWAEEEFGIALKSTTGLLHVAQDEAVCARIEQAVAALDDFNLTGIADALTLTGSPVIAWALYRRHLGAEEAYRAAHLEEEVQLEVWGSDQEAEQRLAQRRQGLVATARFFELLRSAT